MTVTTPVSSTPKRTLDRWIWLAVGIVVVVVGVVVVAFLGAGLNSLATESPDNPFDPGSAGPGGTKALVSVIDDHGVDVEVARGIKGLDDADRPDYDTTVVVSSASLLNPGTRQHFLDRVANAGRIVLVGPPGDLAAFGVNATAVYGSATSAVYAGCTTSGIAPGDATTYGPIAYTTTEPGAVACFTDGIASSVLIMPAMTSRPEIVLMGGDMLVNAHLDQYDNAGVAIRMIAGNDRVLWYVPYLTDEITSDDESSDIPRAIGPLILLSVFVVLALMLWRGRRFGPLVTEPLPAVVKAIETTQARGRMYHRARAVTRSAATLRIQTLTDLARYLGLPYDPSVAITVLAQPDWELDALAGHPAPPGPAVSAIIDAVVAATGRDPAQVSALLADRLPDTEDALVVFTTELTALEKEVHRTP
ncbi:DUF4350 domain-containing protein [Gordonia sp. NPDC003422]